MVRVLFHTRPRGCGARSRPVASPASGLFSGFETGRSAPWRWWKDPRPNKVGAMNPEAKRVTISAIVIVLVIVLFALWVWSQW